MASRTCWICDSEGAGNLRCRMIPVNACSRIRADGTLLWWNGERIEMPSYRLTGAKIILFQGVVN